MAVSYLEYGGDATPVSGRYLAHNHLPVIRRAFLAADLHAGRAQLVDPTVLQAAALARVNSTYAHHAIAQEANRVAIEGKLLPLVPLRLKPARLPVPLVDDVEIISFVRRAGVNRVLEAAIAVEAAQ